MSGFQAIEAAEVSLNPQMLCVRKVLMLIIIKLLSVAAFIGSVFWMIAVPDYEPALAIATSLSTFITTVLIEKRKGREAKQRQSVSGNSIGIQAGGDVSIGNLSGHGVKNSDAK